MKHFLLIFLILLISISLASATDVAYVVKDIRMPNEKVVNAINELNLTYSLIDDDFLPQNFSEYEVILIWNEKINNVEKIPIGQKKSLVANIYYLSNWKIAYSASDYHIGNRYTTGKVMENSLITQDISNITTFYTTYNSLGPISWRLPNIGPYTIGRSCGITNVVGTNDNDAYPIIGIINKGDKLWEGKSCSLTTLRADERIAYFGITNSQYWTETSRQLFKNSLTWVLWGDDKDGDGFFSENDCNDNNAGINPDAAEIEYNYIDENCDNYDLADVDSDGYCKSGYLIMNKLLQCPNEQGIIGTDCNDSVSGINPDAAEIMNNIDENCVNDAPVFSGTIPNLTLNEDENLTNAINLNNYFSDYEGNILSFGINSIQGNFIVNIVNGNVSIIPGKDWNGTGKIVFKASDSLGLYGISNNVTINVLAVNDAPVLSDIADIKAVEKSKITINIIATDADGDLLVYSINNTKFVQDALNKNIFTWQTNYTDAGVYYTKITASDGIFNISKDVKIEILPKIVINEFLSYSSGNEWLEIYNPGNTSFDLTGCYIEDLAFNHIQITGSLTGKSYLAKEFSNILNNDGDTIKLICGGNLIDNVIYGAGNAPVPSLGKSLGRISDGYDTDSNSDWKIYDYPTKGISNSEDMIPPAITLISPENNSEFKTSTAYFNFSVSDNSALTLNCSFYSDFSGSFKIVASGIFQNNTQNYFWKNDFTNGNYKWQIKCSDSKNTKESEIRNIIINMPKAPVVSNISDIIINETETARITINATDSNPEDILVYSVNDIRFIQNETNKNIFAWQTGYNDAGVYYVLVNVTDSVFTINKTVKVTVLGKNRAPLLVKNIENISFNEDETKTINLTEYFSDADGDILNYKVKGNSNISVNIINNIANFSNIKDWNGQEEVIFSANDSKISTDSNSAIIKVNPVNDAPKLNSISDIIIEETDKARITASASDVDGDSLTYGINDARFNQNETNKNIFEWQTGYNDAGVYYVLVNVTDGKLSDSKTVKISVNNKNQIPQLYAIEDIKINEDSGFTDSFVLNASDSDGTISRFEVAKENLSEVDCSASDSLLGVKPAKDFYGNASCTIRVYDDKNAYDEKNVNIIVAGINDAPEIISAIPSFNPIISENGNQLFSANWKDVDNMPAEIKAEWFVNDVLSGIGETYNYNGNEAVIKVKISDLETSAIHEWNVSTSKIPQAGKYNGDTTDFSQVLDLSNTNLILEKQGVGKIEFLEKVNLVNQIDFNHYSEIDSGYAGIDTVYFSGLAGKLARITLYNLGFSKTPAIYYNSGFTLNKSEINSICPSDKCQNMTYSNGTLDFIASFSSFKIGDTLTCSQQSGTICSENENCIGTWISAVESRCCSQSCTKIPPKFSEADTCKNSSSKIEIEIRNPDENDEFFPGDEINVKVKITNNGEEDDFDVKAYLYDTGDDEETDKETESIRIDEGDSENVEFNFIVPNGIDEESDYSIFVYAESDEGLCNQNYAEIKINREKHDVNIKNVRIEPDELFCGEELSLEADLENMGKNDENVIVSVRNSELKIYQEKEIELEKYGDKDSATEKFKIKIPEDAKTGEYKFEIRADFGDDDIEYKTIKFYECEKIIESAIKLSRETEIIEKSPVKSPENKFFGILNIALIIGIILFILAIILVLVMQKR